MEIKGKIVQILPLQGGQTKAGGEWKKQEYILETEGQYPKKVCFNLWGDRIEQYPVVEGEEVTVSFDLDSREFNGRWYTSSKSQPQKDNIISIDNNIHIIIIIIITNILYLFSIISSILIFLL